MNTFTKDEFLKNEETVKKALNFLISEGFMISIHFENHSGEHSLKSHEIYEYIKDKDSCLAEYYSYCLNKKDYFNALKIIKEHGKNIYSISRCCALTTKKRRCKNGVLVPGKKYIACYEDFFMAFVKTINESGFLCDFHENKLNLGSDINILPIKHHEKSQYD